LFVKFSLVCASHCAQGGGWARLFFVRRALELRITALNVALLALCVLTLIAAIAADQACFDYDSLLYAPACPIGESLHAVCAACLALRFGLFIIGTNQEPSVGNNSPSIRVL
jgi:hypothetical protein